MASSFETLLGAAKGATRGLVKDIERELGPVRQVVSSKIADLRGDRNFTLTEEDGVITVVTDLPGVKRRDLKVSITDLSTGESFATVSGLRDDEAFSFDLKFNQLVNAQAAKAELSSGVLTLTIPTVDDHVVRTTDLTVTGKSSN